VTTTATATRIRAGLPLVWLPLVSNWRGWIPWTHSEGIMPILDGQDGRIADDADAKFLLEAIENRLNYDTLLIHTTPEQWPHYREKGTRYVGCTVWETDRIPHHWQKLLNIPDHILVPCRFNAEVFRNNGVKRPISVIPHIYRTPTPVSEKEATDFRAKLGISGDRFVFYTINTWTARKALWETVTAYLEAFTDQDPVTLIVKTDPSGVRSEDAAVQTPTAQNITELLAGRSNIPDIRLICRKMSMREIDLLHRIGDCYLSLTHGEGWGLGAFDAAGIGNPVIITGWGGHLDYLGTSYFGLVNYRLVPVRDRLGSDSFDPGQRWAQADREHAVHLMREIVRNPAAAREKAGRTSDTIRASFSEASVTHRFVEALDEPNTE
ncbi:MAG: hypothetical protein ACU84H_01610, partial [Gammaproteobacteria bacterium]